jgi:hypothetical protein
MLSGRAGPSSALEAVMAKAKKPTAASRARRQKAITRSAAAVKTAHRNLELKLKKHKQVMSAMFFAI